MNRNIKPLKESKKEMLFSGLRVLLTAGLDFSHSFRLLIEEEKEEKIRLLLKEIYASVVDGDTLNGSFARSRQFGALDCGVLRIGEETGRIAETGAGQHGVATATVAALLGLECEIFMGKEDTIRQALNVYRMKLLGAKVNAVETGTMLY